MSSQGVTPVVCSLTKNRRTTFERIDKFLSKDYFVDVNLYGKLYPARAPLAEILHWDATASSADIAADEIDADIDSASITSADDHHHGGPEWKVKVPSKDYFRPYKLGDPFGPTWSTHWFIITIDIPREWIGKEVQLLWDSGSEAMIWTAGQTEPLQAFSGGVDSQMRDNFVLSKCVKESDLKRELWIEVACNDLFGAGAGGMISPPDPKRMFSVKKAEIAVFDREVFDLFTDFEILYGMAKHLPETDPRNYEAMYLANHIINLMKTRPDVPIKELRKLIRTHFSQKNGGYPFKIFALGHCHIDSAWLWQYDETIRKCGRSWITMIRLMEEYPDYRFVASSAQQFAWVKEYYPVIYEQIKKFVKNGQFILVGGTWVEMDGNLPSGEAFIRQFLYGQKFFEEEFGQRCDVFWLPDTFGYSAQLPQIMRLAGIKYFLTQKLSWSLVNKFPHHNFLWRGIDGSEVLVHFPPGDSYGMSLTVEDTLKTVENHKDKGRVHQSVLLYGYGDGGGGPTPPMIERGRRMKDIDGLPKVVLNESITDFFQALEKEKHNLNKWSGELYLELHNGTYTTQAEIKRKNRVVQNLFRDVEFLDVVLFVFFDIAPVDRSSQWHDLLLQQFHDVLPGSSIGLVNQDANRILSGLIETLNDECLAALAHLVSPNDFQRVMFNSSAAQIVYKLPFTAPADSSTSHLLPPYSLSSGATFLKQSQYLTKVKQEKNSFLLENSFVRVVLDQFGQITSMVLKRDNSENIEDRECIEQGGLGNNLVIYDDVPLYWDAWDCMDYHLEARVSAKTLVDSKIDGDSVVVRYSLSKDCVVTQHIRLAPDAPAVLVECKLNWNEKHKFLKMETDVNITSENKRGTYEIQHGWVERPVHRNTSWDWAKFEVCCQRWADFSEHGFGVAVINTGNHGFSIRENRMSLSMLRAPKAPDAEADMGVHDINYAIMPHWGTFQKAGLVQQAIALNDTWNATVTEVPRKEAYKQDSLDEEPGKLNGLMTFFELSNPAVVLDALKPMEKMKERAVVARFYEAFGGTAVCRISTAFPVIAIQECNILEDLIGDKQAVENMTFRVQLKPFEIKTFVLYLGNEIPHKLV